MVAVFGKGMHAFVLDEAELGRRTAMELDNENNVWGAADAYWWRAIGDRMLEIEDSEMD